MGARAGTVFIVELVGGPRYWGLGRSPRINRVRVSLTFQSTLEKSRKDSWMG